jgi:polysaccharide biosynthesis protein PslJ
MAATTARGQRGPVVSAGLLICSLVVLTIAVTAHPSYTLAAASVALLMPFVFAHRWFLAWRRLLATIVFVVLFIPIKRYGLPGNLPFDLEPYRLVVALVIVGWVISLLIDPRVRARSSGLEGPIFLIAVASMLSDVTNSARIHSLNVNSEVIKGLMFLGSFFLLFYLIVSVVRTRADVERLLEIICVGGAVVGVLATIEYRTHFNAFDHMRVVLPFLRATAPDGPGISRGGEVRVFASAQHPIALAGLFVMILPLAVYLALRPGKRRWLVVAAAVALGGLSSVSRTSIVMLLAGGLTFACLRPRATLRAWPVIIPAVVVIQFSLPGVLGSLRGSFFPKGGLIAQQNSHPGWSGSGRLADVGPTLEELWREPLVGEGFSTRQPVKHPETQILDDQWLKTLVETGIIGALAWLWLFVRSIRRLARQSREAADGGWLEVSIAASVAAFAAGMAFYDAFSFIQVTVMLFIILGLGAALGRVALRDVSGARAPRGRADYGRVAVDVS